MGDAVDILCRMVLVFAIFLGVYYRDTCFGRACSIGRNYTGYTMRLLATLVGFTGWVSPVAGVILTCLFVFILVELNYGKQWRTPTVARTVEVESSTKKPHYAAGRGGGKATRDARRKGRVPEIKIERI